MADLGLSGISSGVDTNALVGKLMTFERRSVTRFSNQTKAVQAQQAGLKDIQAKLRALKTTSEGLRAPGLWANKQTAESSNPARIAVQTTGMAPAGGYSIEVRRLASAEQEGFTYAKSATPGELIVGGKSVTIAANASAADLAAVINGNAELAVYATALDDDTIVFSGRQPGSANQFTVASAQLTSDPPLDRAAVDAEYSTDGKPATDATKTWVSSSSNVVDNLVVGVKVTLKGVTSAPETINVGVAALDRDTVKTAVKAFVEAYNDVISTTRGKLDEKGVANPQSTFEVTKGRLFNDSGLTSMLTQMRRAVSDEVGGAAGSSTALDPAMNELLELGISTGKASAAGASTDARMGKLVFDETKFDAALADPGKVRALLGSGAAAGFAQRIEGHIESQIGTGQVFESRLKVSDSQVKRLRDQTTSAEERIVAKEKRLRAQFASMEVAMGRAQTQQGWLSGQIQSLG